MVMKRRYQSIELSKKESEFVEFIQTGSNDWRKAFWIYKHRKKTEGIRTDRKKEQSWFNKTLIRLQRKNLMNHMPFVMSGIAWFNPGVESAKANLVIEQKIEQFQELRHQKPIL